MATSSLHAMARHILMLALGLALGRAELALSASLMVTPVSVDLGQDAASQLLTLKNQEDREIRFEVSAFAWSEDENGEMALAPTEDLVVFPLLSSIAPHGERTVRVGLARRGPTPVERTYRIFFEEMATPRTTTVAGTVRLTMRIGIPVFVAPPKPTATAELESLSFEHGKVRVRLAHRGNAHLRLTSVTITAESANGAPVARRDLKAWYLLAGGARQYDLRLEPEECNGAAQLLVEARWSGGNVSGRVAVPTDGCR